MFDILLGTKFSSKCKHGIKCITTRILTIRRKKQAMVRFLRKDIADLIANGLEINAFGRIEALIVETNHASCYDMIQHYCDYIKSQLPSLQKRECPNVNEVKEAVATLIYAAARFSDLPELCDLRHLFTERYGTDMETSVSAEFVEKMEKKSFSKSTKLQFMQEIAQTFSVTWDSRAFEQKMSTPAAFVLDQPRKGTPSSNQINKSLSMGTARKEGDTEMLSEDIPHKGKLESAPKPRKGTPAHNQINKPPPVSNGRKGTDTEMPIESPFKGKFESNFPRDQPRKGTPTRDQINKSRFESARKEADTRLLTAEVPCKGNFETTLSSNLQKRVQPEPRVVHVVSSINNDQTDGHYGRPRKGFANEPENVTPIRRNAAPPLYFTKDSSNNAQHNESTTHGSSNNDLARKVAGVDRAASMVPPYTKPKGRKPESNAEEHHANRYTYDVSPRAAEGPIDPRIQEKQPANRVSSSNGRPFSMMPPYVKPKSNIRPADDDWSNGGEFTHQDALLDEKPEPLPVRSRRTKPQVFSEIETTIDDNNLVSGRRRHGEQQSYVIYDEEHNEGEKRRGQDPKLAVWDEMPVDPTPSGSRRHGSRRSTDAVYDKYCDEEVVMDQLLMHYSTKGTDNKPGKTRTRAPRRERVLDSTKVLEQQSGAKFYHRVASSSKEPIRLAEAVRGPARAASMQPEILSPGGRCAHPKPPGYDNLTAQFRALRGA